jgi:hypothetical protein
MQPPSNSKALSRHSPGGTEENKSLSHGSRSPCRDLNQGPPGYESGVLPLNHDIGTVVVEGLCFVSGSSYLLTKRVIFKTPMHLCVIVPV